MRIDVVSIFPEYLAPLDLSLIGKARRDGLVDLRVHDLRDWTTDRHRTVDDTPYGGGAGMVMKPEPWAQAVDALVEAGERERGGARPLLVVPGPGGRRLDQALAHELSAEPWLAFACGRYEGIDERVYEYAAERLDGRVLVLSLGDYVLNGGEAAVLATTEAVVRLLPGVVGNAESLVEESHEDGLLEYPVYTKPAVWRDRAVPPVLLSGDHGAIARWRHEQRLERTAARRPDLLPASSVVTAGSTASPAPATAGDAGELLTLQRACGLPDVGDDPATAAGRPGGAAGGTALDALRATLVGQGPETARTWVLRLDGRLVACVSTSGEDGGEAWRVSRLAVAPDLQGRGLGRAMLAHAESLAPSAARSVRLDLPRDGEAALRLARRSGYRPARDQGERPEGRVALVRTLRRPSAGRQRS